MLIELNKIVTLRNITAEVEILRQPYPDGNGGFKEHAAILSTFSGLDRDGILSIFKDMGIGEQNVSHYPEKRSFYGCVEHEEYGVRRVRIYLRYSNGEMIDMPEGQANQLIVGSKLVRANGR